MIRFFSRGLRARRNIQPLLAREDKTLRKHSMDKNGKAKELDVPTATDADVAAAARQLGLSIRGSAASRSRNGEVVQRLAHGRSHAVAVEIKHSRRHSA